MNVEELNAGLAVKTKCQRLVSRHINALKKLVKTVDVDGVDTGDVLLVKLASSKLKYDEAFSAASVLATTAGMNYEEEEATAQRINQDVDYVTSATKEWIEEMTRLGQIPSPEEENEDSDTEVATPPKNPKEPDKTVTMDMLKGIEESIRQLSVSQEVKKLKQEMEEQRGWFMQQVQSYQATITGLKETLDRGKMTVGGGDRVTSTPIHTAPRRVKFGPSSLPTVPTYQGATAPAFVTPVTSVCCNVASNVSHVPYYTQASYIHPNHIGLGQNNVGIAPHESHVRSDIHSQGSNGIVTGDSRYVRSRSAVSVNRDVSYQGVPSNSRVGQSNVTQTAGDEAGIHNFTALLDRTEANQRTMIANLKAPQVELPKFSGDPLEFTSFMDTFDDLVGDVIINSRAKLTTLMAHCEGKAKLVIASCVHKPSAEGYPAARNILAAKFGDPTIICEAWMTKLLGSSSSVVQNDELDSFARDLTSCRDCLRTLGFASELECTNTIRLIVAKLPLYLRGKWRKQYRKCKSEGNASVFSKLVELVTEAAEDNCDPTYSETAISRVRNTYEGGPTPSSRPFRKGNWQPHQRRQAVHHVQEEIKEEEEYDEAGEEEEFAYHVGNSRAVCQVCSSGQHFTSRCRAYKLMSPPERLNFVRTKKLCVLCLSNTHAAMTCPLPWKCQDSSCSQRHHTTLHQAMTEADKQTSEPKEGGAQVHMLEQDLSEGDSVDGEQTSVEFTYMVASGPFLPLIAIVTRGPGGVKVTYALLDTGSTMTLCTTRLAEVLGLDKSRKSETMINTVSAKSRVQGALVDMEVRGANGTDYIQLFNAFTVDKLPISANHLATRESVNCFRHLEGLILPSLEIDSVDLLIGQNNAHLLEPLDKIKGGIYDPYAVLTPLGWTVHGTGRNDRTESQWNFATSEELVPESTSLEMLLERFWEVEAVPKAMGMSVADKLVSDLWKKEVEVKDGHIYLPIPYKQYPPGLPDNYVMAEKALLSLGRRLDKNPEMLRQYQASKKKNFDLGFAEKVEGSVYVNWDVINYLIHHGVQHPRKIGVTRVVSDGRREFKGVSINTATHRGPDQMNKMLSVLTKFRQYRYATTGDVDQMFNQVMVPEKHRDSLRFLWWDSDKPDGNVIICRWKTHTFGVGWAPAAAAQAMCFVAEMFGDKFHQDAVRAVKEEVYVDDWQNSVPTIQKSISLVRDVRSLVGCGGFNLGKFGGNCKEVLDTVEADRRAKAIARIDFKEHDLPQETTLGVGWDQEKDLFTYTATMKMRELTKRGVMSSIASLYDPLGFLAPFTTSAKCLMQAICKLKIRWEDEIPDDILEQWLRWRKDLPIIEKFFIPRWLGCTPQDESELHVFVDASERAYGAVVYLRAKERDTGVTRCNIVLAKAKVSPIQVKTIPRLELCAAVVGVKLLETAKSYLNHPIAKTWCWSDSLIVLRYMQKDAADHKTFVANRIAFIQENSCVEDWRHIPTAQNPADLLSRGVKIEDLVTSRFWLQGPSFLTNASEEWPKRVELSEVATPEEEVKKKKQVYVTIEESEPIMIRWQRRYSSWIKLLRAGAWLRRFLLWKSRAVVNKGELTAMELKSAEMAVITLNQEHYFSVNQLKGKQMSKLQPVQEDYVWKVGGRLQYADLPGDKKHQILVPKDSPIADLIIFHYHNLVGHCGIDRTVLEIRDRFWIVDGKRKTRNLLRNCFLCRRFKESTSSQLMAPLPESRLQMNAPPFTSTGVDYMGPVSVKIGRSLVKRYICVLVCMTTRACHIEPACDLTTSAFINLMERFVARRGKPMLMQSDNGTNFIGARTEIHRLRAACEDPNLTKYMTSKGITWRLNAPGGSHQGGSWERINRSTRQLLLMICQEQTLTDDRLSTLLCMVEYIQNSRPLTRLNEDPDSLSPLTPNHLLMMKEGVSLLDSDFAAESMRKDFRQVQYLASLFWSRWLKQYLPELQKRSKWTQKKPNLKTGQLVLIANEQTPRMKWPIGVIQQVHPGRDNLVRNVTVRTSKGSYLRPVTKIVALEADIDSD